MTPPSRSARHVRRASAVTLAALLGVAALTLVGCASSGAGPTPTLVEYPSPLTGPGVPPVEKADRQRLARGWSELTGGDPAAAAATASTLAPLPAATLLRLQARAVTDPAATVPELQMLVEAHDRYAAAWATLSLVAEAAGRDVTAYGAARRTADLWHDPRWADRATGLQRHWIEQPLADADSQLAEDPTAALATADAVLQLEPDDTRAQLLRARSLAALGRLDEADAAAAALPSDPRAGMLRGELAERRSDWLAAMDLYRAVPADQPGRDRALRRVQLRWRLEVLPQWVHEAEASPELNRAQLAVLLVSVLPGLESVPGDPPPVLSDIVDLPSQREIVTAVRLDLMSVDRLEHHFSPWRPVTADEARAAVDAALERLDMEPVEWCSDTVVSSACHTLVAPVSGHDVTAVLIDAAEREKP